MYNYKPTPYNIETIHVENGDVILLHLNKEIDLDSATSIYKEVSKAFPNNQILFANEHVLQGITILKPPIGEVNIVNWPSTEHTIDDILKDDLIW